MPKTRGHTRGNAPLTRINDRVGEAAHRGNDRDRAVAQTVHLIEAGWLKARRHEENVGAGNDAMCQPFVITHACRNATGMSSSLFSETSFEFCIALARNGKPRSRIGEIADALQDEVKPFL